MIKQFFIAIIAIAFLAATFAMLQGIQANEASHFMQQLAGCIK